MNNLSYANSGPTNKGSNFHTAVMRSQKRRERQHVAFGRVRTLSAEQNGHQSREFPTARMTDQRTPRHHRGGDSGSVAISSKSDQMIIKKNVQYTVQYEEVTRQRRKHRSLFRSQSA